MSITVKHIKQNVRTSNPFKHFHWATISTSKIVLLLLDMFSFVNRLWTDTISKFASRQDPTRCKPPETTAPSIFTTSASVWTRRRNSISHRTLFLTTRAKSGKYSSFRKTLPSGLLCSWKEIQEHVWQNCLMIISLCETFNNHTFFLK